MDKNNENKKINTRATIVNTDSRSTQIQTPKSRKTSVKNNSRSTESLSVNKETSSLNIGDIIDGYKIINPINVVSGQAYIYISDILSRATRAVPKPTAPLQEGRSLSYGNVW